MNRTRLIWKTETAEHIEVYWHEKTDKLTWKTRVVWFEYIDLYWSEIDWYEKLR